MATSRVLSVAERSPRWQERVGPALGEARLLTAAPPRATVEIVDLSRQGAPWPVPDRDAVTTSNRATIPDTSLLKHRWPVPRAMTSLRIVLGLIWLAAAVSHMFWGGPDPCTCTHP